MSDRTIAVPAGADMRLSMRAPDVFVVVAPQPLKADLDVLLSAPCVVGMFTHDRGVTWPDRQGCRWASTYLATGHAICLKFANLADAMVAHRRLLASVEARP